MKWSAASATQKVEASVDGLLLMAQIRNDQQAVSAILRRGQHGANRTESELQAVAR